MSCCWVYRLVLVVLLLQVLERIEAWTLHNDKLRLLRRRSSVPPPSHPPEKPPRQQATALEPAVSSGSVEDYEGYSVVLSPKNERETVWNEGREFSSKRGFSWQRLWQRPTRPGSLILLRCGQSEFNVNQTFTGWADPALTPLGRQECVHAGELLLAEGFDVDVVYTSRLRRSIQSAWIVLETMNAVFLPVRKTYRLNQRMYGALQGLSKISTAQSVGDPTVQAWRNSLKARPPPLSRNDPNHPMHDRRYADLQVEEIPDTESLLDCQARARPLWQYKIKLEIASGKNVMVVAHRDSIRGLIKVLEELDDTQNIQIPNGIPLVYKFDRNLQLVRAPNPAPQLSARFLEKGDQLKTILERQTQWSTKKFLETDAERRVVSLQQSLKKLRRSQSLHSSPDTDDDRDVVNLETQTNCGKWTDDPSEFEEYDEFEIAEDQAVVPTVLPLPNNATTRGTSMPTGAFVVLIRHGRTPHNNLGLFTGWEDPPLAEDGIQDARNAGQLLRRHGFEFDVAYTSWLTRAIQTAYYVLDELDCLWLPLVKSWALNERMYGSLTGKSKKRVANEFGEEQLKKWRRGYSVRPPRTSSYSPSYPGNDLRRAKHFKDLPISWKETIFRSLEERRPSLHRRFPKTESLKDCMDRSIPFYTERIRKEAVEKGKRVLIASHENAIRGLLMHLCDVPEEAMNQLHVPNGLPLIYNVKGRCLSLLDDGSDTDPMVTHDFGPAAQYLFKACVVDDAFYEEMLQRRP